MPLPQLKTNIDVSNALFKIADQERARQEQGKIDTIRSQQLTNANALNQYNINRLEAARIKDDFDTKIKQIGMIDYSKGVQNHNDFKAGVDSQNPALGNMIPYLDPADPTSLQRGKDWQARSLDLLVAHKAGYAPKEVRLVNKSTGEDRIEWVKSGESYTPPKGWSIYNKEEENKDKKYYPTESGYTTQPEGKMPFRADRQPAPLPTKDWVKIGTDILANADKPEVISEMVDMYNNESPNNVVMIPMTHKVKQKISSDDRTFPWSSKEEEVDKVLVTKIDLNKYGLSKQPLIKYANDRGIPLNQVIDAAIKVKTRKGTKK